MTLKHSSRKKTVITLFRWLGTLLTSGLFIWLISRQNWNDLLSKAAGIPLWALLLTVMLVMLSYGFNTLRWCILLWAQDVKITFWQALCMAWAGSFASNFLPSTIGGDGLRMVGIFRYTERKTIGVGSVVLDRLVNLAAMIFLVPLPILIFGGSLAKLFSGAALVLPGGLQSLFERYFPKIANAFRAWASRPVAFLYAFLAAWPSNLLPIAANYLVARQLGLDVSFWQVAAVQTVTYFLAVSPISFNGFGIREVTFTTLYPLLGATLEQATVLALVTRFLIMLATVPGALWLSGSVTNVALSDDTAADGIE